MAGSSNSSLLEIIAQEPPSRFRVVGVVADSLYESLTEGEKPIVYLPAMGNVAGNWTLLVRVDQAERASAVRSRLDQIDRRGRYDVSTLESRRESMLRTPRFLAGSAVVLCVLVLGLASGSVWSLLSVIISQQRRSIAIRLALGATPRVAAIAPLRSLLPPLVGGGLAGVVATILLSRVELSRVTGPDQLLALPLWGIGSVLGALAVAGLLTYYLASRIRVFQCLRDL
jgi:ABC-type lipoprotein release transport system permease subunit